MWVVIMFQGALVSQEATEKTPVGQSAAAGARVSYGGVAPQSHPTNIAPHMVDAASPVTHQMSPPQYHHQMSPQSSPATITMSPSGAEYPYENQVKSTLMVVYFNGQMFRSKLQFQRQRQSL